MKAPGKGVGARIRKERRHARLTLEQLAEQAGISTSFLAYIERNERRPGLETIERLAQALGMPLAELFDSTDERSGNAANKALREFSRLIRGKDSSEIAMILRMIKAMGRARH